MKLLTIAIPAYNAEKLLPQALDSVIDDRIEALVINDGSSDNTEAVALEYQKKYPNIVRVISKENGGWGSGINRAILEAKGEYFANLDADDWYSRDGLLKVLDNLENHKVDLLIAPGFEHSTINDAEWPIQFPNNCTFEEELSFDILADEVDHYFTVHSLFFKTSVLQMNGVKIDECFYTDTELIAYPLEFITSAYVQKEAAYIYRVDQANQSISVSSMGKHVDDMKLVANNVCAWYLQQNKRKKYYSKIACAAAYGYITYPFALNTDRQGKYINQLRAFKADVLSKDEYLSNLNNYGIFARLVLNSNFNKYALAGKCWRFSMEHRKLSSFIWRIIR